MRKIQQKIFQSSVFQKLLQNSMLWRSACVYIVTFVHWNIVFMESCMYKFVLGKISKLQKKQIIVSTDLTSTSHKVKRN
jgi:hypothetical protein